jgi:hypothetical protein
LQQFAHELKAPPERPLSATSTVRPLLGRFMPYQHLRLPWRDELN